MMDCDFEHERQVLRRINWVLIMLVVAILTAFILSSPHLAIPIVIK